MQSSNEYRGWLAATVVAVAVGVASYAVLSSDPFAEHNSQLFTLDLSSLYEIDPELILFEQTAEIQAKLDDVRCLAVGPADNIYVAGDQAIRVFSPSGSMLSDIQTDGKPSCLGIGWDKPSSLGHIYVGAGTTIEVFRPDGSPVGAWKMPNNNAILTSIAVANDNVFVADAGNRVILRFDESGQLVGSIGEATRAGRKFEVPSAYFDIAISSDGLLHVANPGVLRIETYNFAGDMAVRWGEAGSAINQFFGCCNPSQFAVLPGGSVVTSEKGVPRIKVYSEFGEFECVVAGPQQLDVAESELGDPRAVQAKAVFDVAADSRGRVLVLDPRRRSVRIFTRKTRTENAPQVEETANDEA